MKRFIFVTTFFASILAVSNVGKAQDCSNLSDWDLRGTYAISGSGFIDLSKLLPGMGLPSATAPMTWVGALTFIPNGSGGGWVTLSAGGAVLTAQLTGWTYSVQKDCSVQSSFSMKIKSLNATIGPFPRTMVIVPKPGAMELRMILGGPNHPPDPNDIGLDLGAAYRISTQY